MAIKLLVDSSCDIEQEEANSMGIDMIPMEIMIDGEVYFDGVNLSHVEFFKKLEQSTDFPKTSQITKFRYEEKFVEMTKNGDSVIAICLSSKLSGSYNQAVDASKQFANVYVVDSLNASVGERILINYAMELIDKNLMPNEIVDLLNEKKTKIKVFAALATLKYLKKGGRISPLVAMAGTMLNIKPIIMVDEGEIKMAGKAIGSRKGNIFLNELIGKTAGIDFGMPYSTAFTGAETTLLDKYIEDSKNIWQKSAGTVPRHMIGSTVGTHVDPGVVAVAFFEK